MRTSFRALVGASLLITVASACIVPGGNPPGSTLFQSELERRGDRTNDALGGAEVFLPVWQGPVVGIAGVLPHNDGDADVDQWRVVVPEDVSIGLSCAMGSAGAVFGEIYTGTGELLAEFACGDQPDVQATSATGAYVVRVTTETGGASSDYRLEITQLLN